MRIIGGRLGGRRFNPPLSKWPTRPTTDLAREGLFNILQHSIELSELKALDLFGGSGGISFELCSRGCEDVTYVDSYYPCVRFVKKQSEDFDLLNNLKVVKSDVFKFLQKTEIQYDLIIADPPYDLKSLATLPDKILALELLTKDGLLIIEHDEANNFDDHAQFWKARKYGDSIFSFFQLKR